MKRVIVLADEKSAKVVNGSGRVRSLAKIDGLPLIVRNLRILHAAGVEEAIVVTGFEASQLFFLRNGQKNILNSKTIEVFVKDKDLYYKTDDNITKGPLLSMHTEKPWFARTRTFNIFCFSKSFFRTAF